MSAARAKRADLASSAGAALLGAGLGAMLSAHVVFAAPALIVLGVLLHGWGMLERRRLEAGSAIPRWARVLYWACWAGLALIALWTLARQ